MCKMTAMTDIHFWASSKHVRLMLKENMCAAANMKCYDSPLHIASAFVVENGITIDQLAADSKKQ